jgi:ABC-type transport system involved in cytochrome bd biosynthesis fused ATPase/permease subunit
MQQALRFRSLDAEALDREDFVEQSRQFSRGPETLSRGLALTIRHLRKSFGDNEVLRGIDLHIPAGQFVAIVGRSGCGKSTLLRLLAGLERADAGAITIDGDTREAHGDETRIIRSSHSDDPFYSRWSRKALTGLKSGDMLIAECTDPLTAIDIPNLLNQTGDKLESSGREGDVLIVASVIPLVAAAAILILVRNTTATRHGLVSPI